MRLDRPWKTPLNSQSFALSIKQHASYTAARSHGPHNTIITTGQGNQLRKRRETISSTGGDCDENRSTTTARCSGGMNRSVHVPRVHRSGHACVRATTPGLNSSWGVLGDPRKGAKKCSNECATCTIVIGLL